jgi:hypothetical protein
VECEGLAGFCEISWPVAEVVGHHAGDRDAELIFASLERSFEQHSQVDLSAVPFAVR